MSYQTQPRNNGRFDFVHRDETDIHGVSDSPADSMDAYTVGPEELWKYVNSPDPDERADCAYNPNIQPEQMEALCSPDQPLRVRMSALKTRHPIAMARLMEDPDPVVRYHCATISR